MQEAESGALAGLRVVELGSSVAVAYCTRLLAAFGADVVLVEPPEGHPLRHLEAIEAGPSGLAWGPHALYLHAGKRSETLDLGEATGREGLWQLLTEADVAVHDLQPSALTALGCQQDRLAGRVPQLIETSITPFGRTGPYADWSGGDLLEYALGGLMYVSGAYHRPPVVHGAHQSGYRGGVYAAAATLTAVAERWRSGLGQQVDVALSECIAPEIRTNVDEYVTRGMIRRREPIDGPGLAEQGVMACRDGFITAVVGGHFDWSSFAPFMDLPELAEPRFATAGGRIAHGPEMNALMRPRLLERGAEEWFELAQLWRFIWGPVRDLRQVSACPQLANREAWCEVAQPGLGSLRMPKVPFRMSAGPLSPPAAAPALKPLRSHGPDGHVPVAGWRSRPAKEQEPNPGWDAHGSTDPRPLAGLRVLDLGNWVTIPYLCRELADMGAEVVKVESPKHLTVGRIQYGAGPSFSEMHRNKRSVTIELDCPAGIDVFKRLVSTADVLAENFAPRVMGNLGLTYEILREVNPRLIYLSSTAFGQSGPYRDYGAFGSTLESMIGLASVTGLPDDPPTRCGLTYTDYPAAQMGYAAILAALAYRRRSGKGQYIDLSQYETGVALMGGELVAYALRGELPARRGNRAADRAPQGVYRCAGDDNWLAISVGSDAQFALLCAAIGREELALDPKYATVAGRRRQHDALDMLIGGWARAQDHRAAMKLFQGRGVPAAAVLNPKALLLDEQCLARDYYRPDPPPGTSLPPDTPLVTGGLPWRLSRTPGGIARWVPGIGQDNQSIFKEVVGLTDSEYAEVVAEGVITPADRIGPPVAGESVADVPLETLKSLGRITGWDDDYAAIVSQAYGREDLRKAVAGGQQH